MSELDAEYVEKMEDVLRLYERPCRSAEPVICLDEKPVSLHSEVRPYSPPRPGHVAKRDNEYKRHGTANIYAVVEPKTGRHFSCVTANRKAPQFAAIIAGLVDAYPLARVIHLVMDNLNIHRRKALEDAFGQAEAAALWSRLRIHYTPKHGSWLNMAEIELGLITRQCLGRRRFPSREVLESEVNAWRKSANRVHLKIHWNFSRKNARSKFRYSPASFKRSET